ncbi:hypothetical protein HY008_00765 [Candidatus Woesebacteria bacterium]|nr:hypothetical protein [Candidatus Woesebacteria bacterium]
MSKLVDFLSGSRILEEVESPINGKLTVIRNLAWGTYIKAHGVTQSGGVLKKVWESTIKSLITSHKSPVTNCLILGLGGGSVAQLIRKYWPEAKITGVDIDPVIIELGTRYLALDRKEVKVVIQDAMDFVSSVYSSGAYDLICVDLYIGDKYPKKFESEDFLKLLTKGDVAIFNRLYGPNERRSTIKFGKKLSKIFSKVETVYPEANVMFLCSQD